MMTPTTDASHPMPAAFFGHGSPMNALESNRFTAAWRAFGASIPRPRAILVVSAHWYIDATAVTSMARPRAIHDFFGFPRRLFEVQYPAPGDPELAAEVAEIAKPAHVRLDPESWGIDHGAWSVLVHAFPGADVPVVQLAIHALKPFDYHLELGARLAPLRDRGVLVLASGNVVHNLHALDWSRSDFGFDWAHRFDDAARAIMTERPAEVGRLRDHPDYARAAPTPDHFVPLLYVAGLAAAAGHRASPLVDGHAFGSLSMACYAVDAPRAASADDRRVAAGSSDPPELTRREGARSARER
ncbi:4,5-DOPA-extradiol-dioxygenase [Anaeromyxobacter oryzisoli]|uniref:4,5-DOPA-extradiol-dioxygenase n=1 Tax=Anaeromyxobacter oryzisoli TaxID=2925408 RepID=UPI001F56AB05|nr:4,5-DOPA dioxygenase extradiol [Anaeromyxobacter sp. SG63]